MNPKIIYPIPIHEQHFYRIFRKIMMIIFVVSAIVCVIVNILTKGKPWSIIVLWTLFALWQLIFSLTLMEFSIFAHATKSIFFVLVLLWLIDHFLVSGWAATVMPIVAFVSLFVMIIIFYALYSRKEKHLLSVLWLGLISLVLMPFGFADGNINWIPFSFSLASLVIFSILLITDAKNILHELKVRFRAKESEE